MRIVASAANSQSARLVAVVTGLRDGTRLAPFGKRHFSIPPKFAQLFEAPRPANPLAVPHLALFMQGVVRYARAYGGWTFIASPTAGSTFFPETLAMPVESLRGWSWTAADPSAGTGHAVNRRPWRATCVFCGSSWPS